MTFCSQVPLEGQEVTGKLGSTSPVPMSSLQLARRPAKVDRIAGLRAMALDGIYDDL